MSVHASGVLAANAEALFCDYFDSNARWRGNRRALVFENTTLKWAELASRVYQIANGLISLGVRKQERVVLLLDNRLETLEIALGVIRSGACLVPINLHISTDAIARQIEDCGAVAVLATSREAARIEAAVRHFLSERRIVVGDSADGWTDYSEWRERQRCEIPSVSSLPGDLFTVVYSSGTTGIPKGIAHSHITRIRNMRGLGHAFRLHEDAAWITSLGFYSNAAMLPILMTLLVGGCAVILPKFDSSHFLQCVQTARATHSLIVPTMLRALLHDPARATRDLSSLELVCVGGAATTPELKEAGRSQLKCVLLELYGLTEGFLTITSTSDGDDKLGSVGRPFPGSDLRILRDDGSEASIGEVGEIVGLTEAIMLGYLNRPEETAAAQLLDDRGRRWLKTGDLGKLDADGFLYYVDRRKDLIVSGGQNIYPIDIEDVGRQHPDVDQIAVVGIPHPKWDETPVAVIVPRPGRPVREETMQTWLNDRLGSRQRVAAVILETQLPVNAMGKVLKRELRAKILSRSDVSTLAQGRKE